MSDDWVEKGMALMVAAFALALLVGAALLVAQWFFVLNTAPECLYAKCIVLDGDILSRADLEGLLK